MTLAEFNVRKKAERDGRGRSNGRADFWMRHDDRAWSFEFKQITSGSLTLKRLRARMSAADRCATKLLRYGPEHMMSGLIVPLYYVDARSRVSIRERLTGFAEECHFAWHLASPEDGPETFLFFNQIERAPY